METGYVILQRDPSVTAVQYRSLPTLVNSPNRFYTFVFKRNTYFTSLHNQIGAKLIFSSAGLLPFYPEVADSGCYHHDAPVQQWQLTLVHHEDK